MQSRQEMKLTLGAERFLAPGETVVRCVAVAKGATHHEAGTPQAASARPTRARAGACVWRRRSGSS